MKWIPFAVFPFALTSCTLPNSSSEYRPDISVYCVLSPQQDQQILQVYNTTEELRFSIAPESLFVKDAEVTIRSGMQMVELNYAVQTDTSALGYVTRQQMYADTYERLRVIPGESYELSVRIHAELYSGTTKVPGSFDVLSPVPGEKFTLDENILLKWQPAKGAAGYLISLYPPPYEVSITPDSSIFIRYPHIFETDKTEFIIPPEYIDGSGGYDIVIEGYDENYRRFVYEEEDRSGLDQGYGLFASKSSASGFFIVE